MQRLILRYREATELRDQGDIPALHGLRALMVFLVAAFHIWQQSWLAPSFGLFGVRVGSDPLLRSGYMWVDGMLLLSGFLCYLPHAWAQETGRQPPGALHFYRRRLARIFPTYALHILFMLLFIALPQGLYNSGGEAAADAAAHLSFTHTLFYRTYWMTPLNGALWTLAVEMQFYLLFPLLARAFRRMPLPAYLGMAGLALGFRAWAATQADTGMYFNQLPAFLDVYANGFVAASIYVSLRRRMKEDAWTRVLMSACALAAVAVLAGLVRGQALQVGSQLIRLGQMERRFAQSVMTALALLGFSLGLPAFRLLLGNPVTRYLSAISFQFYMWHQVIAVQLRRLNIPFSADPYPNRTGDIIWQRQYVFLCIALALTVSTLITYLIEKPLNRRLLMPLKNTRKQRSRQ